MPRSQKDEDDEVVISVEHFYQLKRDMMTILAKLNLPLTVDYTKHEDDEEALDNNLEENQVLPDSTEQRGESAIDSMTIGGNHPEKYTPVNQESMNVDADPEATSRKETRASRKARLLAR